MISEQAKKFGAELREARENKGYTLKDIYAQTRIDEKYLEALENGEFSVLPEVYIRAFIREYSAEVDLDPEEMLRKYELVKEGRSIDSASAKNDDDKIEKEQPEIVQSRDDKIFEDDETIRPKQNGKSNNTFYYYATGILAFLLIVIYLLFGNSSDEQIVIENKYEPPQKTNVEKPTENIGENKTATNVEQKANEITPQKNEFKQVQTNPFEITFTGTDTVWMRVKIDNDKTEEFMLYPGVSRIIKVNEEANALIGNSGGVEIYLDGKKMDFNGEKGKIKNVLISKSGLIYQKIKKKSESEN